MIATAVQTAVVGASGIAGTELVRLLGRHPHVAQVRALSSRVEAAPAAQALPVDLAVEPFDPAQLEAAEVVFLCTPHGHAATFAQSALAAGARVIDLSADFRLASDEVYAATYGTRHPAPELLAQAVYGLTEQQRRRIADARLVANPGCYPTSILLPLLPLLERELIGPEPIIADSKSGVSGAGKTPSARTHFANTHENFCAYGVGTHRHTPEIWQVAGTERIVFVPHLLPVYRGILTTLYFTPASGTTLGDVQAALHERYADEPFVRVYERGLPELNRVQHTNFCDIACAQAGSQIVVVSVLDNLLKGAAGQALQNMNCMLGFSEELGLT